MQYCKTLKEDIIKFINNNEHYIEFNSNKSFFNNLKTKYSFPNRNVYTCEQCHDDDLFLSIDLKKANFQALKFFHNGIFLSCNTYEEYMRKFTDLQYIIDSKDTRQYILGNLNSKRTVAIEKFIMDTILDSKTLQTHLLPYYDVFSVNSDEIILKFKKDIKNTEQYQIDNCDWIKKSIKDENRVDVKVSKFKLKVHEFKSVFSDNVIRVFEKYDVLGDEKNTLKCVPITYYTQIYKLIKGLEVTKEDLVFYYEHELSSFLEPLIKL